MMFAMLAIDICFIKAYSGILWVQVIDENMEKNRRAKRTTSLPP